MSNHGLDPIKLNALLLSQNANWRAGNTSVSALSLGEQARRLGYVPGTGEKTLEQRISTSSTNLAATRCSS